VNGIVGGSAIFSLEIPPGAVITEVSWNSVKRKTLIAEFIDVHYRIDFDKHFKNRLHLFRNFSLQINQLHINDTGNYTAQIIEKNGSQNTITYSLQVYGKTERVSTPVRVVTTSSASHNGIYNVTLNCSVETGSQVQYSWSSEDGAVRDAFQYLSVGGAILHLTLKPEDYNKSVTCTASNPVSKESASVTPWDYCMASTTKGKSYF
uniref:Ig-like domain-containing protein n=1 Tax=Latimeria chalumnae TaxID=7897 RepID=H2ZYT0_LATCH